MKVFIIWLIGVILWNFGYPLEDVLVAIILSFISMYLKKFIKN